MGSAGGVRGKRGKMEIQIKVQIQIQKYRRTNVQEHWDQQAVSGVKGGRWSGAAGSDWGGRHRIIATDNILFFFSIFVFCQYGKSIFVYLELGNCHRQHHS